MYFRVCPHCGCALDPSERCDCQQERRSKQEQEERRAQNGKVHVYGAGQHSISAQARGAKVSGTVNHMLHAGAKIAREEMQAALKEYKDVRMRDKIQARMREVFQEEMSKNGGNEGKWNVEEVETEE